MYFSISWDEDEYEFSCGWLLSEFIRRYRATLAQPSVIPNVVALASRQGSEALDFWLTCYERPLTPLRNGESLVAIFSKPT